MAEFIEGVTQPESGERLKTLATGYHYTSPGRAEWLLKGFPLNPSSPLVRYPDANAEIFPREAFTLYTFALINSPKPKEWVHNDKLLPPFNKSGSWSLLMAYILTQSNTERPKLEMIGFDVLPTDDAYVVDWGEVEKQILAKSINTLYKREVYPELSEAEGWKNYMNSKVPLSEYKQGSFLIPELILANPISSDRLTHVGEVKLKPFPVFSWFKTKKAREWRSDRRNQLKEYTSY